MVVFENCSVLLELKTLPFKEKKKLRAAITENGGSISFVVNKQCSLVVTSDLCSLSSNRLRSVQKHRTPVVRLDYVYSCLSSGVRLPVDAFQLDPPSPPPAPSSPELGSIPHQDVSQREEGQERNGNVLEKFRIFTERDFNLPPFPDDFQVAKYSVFEKGNSGTWSVLELQSARGGNGQRYRVVCYLKDDIGTKKAAVKDKLVFVSTSEDALQVFQALSEALQADGLQLRTDNPPEAQDLGSGPLQQLLLEEKLSTGSLSREVGVFVELLWTEALGSLGNILSININKLSLNDVSRAEGLLLQAQRNLKEGNHTEAITLLKDAYTLLPHNAPQLLPTVKLISQKLDLCQLIRDVLSVSEMTLRYPVVSCVGKYRALRCSIEDVPSSSSEFQAVTALLWGSNLRVKQVLRVSRGVELQMFKSEIGNIQTLLHSSNPTNFVGILSRGLLLPRVGVEHHGIERTDVGNLGSGIYFSDAISTCLKYSTPSVTDGSRLLLVCEVALGSCRHLHRRDCTLTQAPEGHHSVHGVQRTPNVHSEFEDDEYVVYSPDQVKLKYVIQFSLEGEELKEFSPVFFTSAEHCLVPMDQEVYMEDDRVESVTSLKEDVKVGLLDSSGQQLPLEAVHVKGKLIDLLSQVIIFQKYTNTSSVPIEAKYVFPLDESAAVCGFEAFINGKHIVGQVKEKETARKEYKQAVEKGHGAYLMDQDAPDVFTISVGNLPPGATVLIKVTFVSELIVKDGSVFFSLPGSVAPWKEKAALNQTTQVTVEKVCVTDASASSREFSLDMSVEMPYEISRLQCLTHKVHVKRTDCKAVLSVLPGEVMGPEGFQLSVTLSEVHLPRMWVEKHPDKDSQACMLVFYPEFEINSSSACDEVVLLLDTSESMRGESLRMAQRIALQVLKALDQHLRVNVILFSTDHKEAFLAARPVVEAREEAAQFIKLFTAVGGSTELWRPLRALSLLPPSRGIRNLLLLSDGHIQNPEPTLKLLRANAQHSRLFSCGLSSTANRHMLRALAQAGAGAYEFFDTKTKHTWTEKVARQVKRMASPGCSSVSVKWQQFSASAPTPVQAPQQIHALFNDCHTLVYGFVPHCTQATLFGDLSGQELKTMVSTSELQKTRGTFLHKLTARALIRDYEDGNLDTDEAEHEGKKAELKSFIVELSKEFSILSQFTSFVAIEERGSDQSQQGFTDIPKLIAEEDVDILPYISWASPEESFECSDVDFLSESMDQWPSLESSTTVCLDRMNYGEPTSPHLTCGYIPTKLIVALPPALTPIRLGASEVAFPLPPPSAHLQAPASRSFLFGASLRAPAGHPPPSAHLQAPASRSFLTGAPSRPASYSLLSLDEAKCAAIDSLTEAPLFQLQAAASGFSSWGTSLGALPPLSPPSADSQAPTSPCFSPGDPEGAGNFELASLDVAPAPPAHRRRSVLQICGTMDVHGSMDVSAPPEVSPPPSAQSLADQLPQSFAQQAQQIQSADMIVPQAKKKFKFRAGRAKLSQGSILQPEFQSALAFTHLSCRTSLSAASALQQIAPPPPPPPPPQPLHRLSRKSESAHREGVCFYHTPVLHDLAPADDYVLARRGTRLRKSPVKPLKVKWTKIFLMQQTEGYWELTTALGELIDVNVDVFMEFLKSKGINSLGVRAHAEILRLVATLLILQLMRLVKQKEGKLLRTLFSLEESEPRPRHWEQMKRAVKWVCWAERQYPCIYSRLEFGSSWESATRQLLGFEDLPPLSPLVGLNLQKIKKNPLPSRCSSTGSSTGSSTDSSTVSSTDSSWEN
ncbi:protein mono-ADP-ribosyltransferase PARP4 isoform X2 [Betta splendens]|uniref:Poly [ADP-ribose] polymerase n=1 Tax=Betta splendens TaxID=158456 RepID=A0A9W2XH40_BETSP|nr:protein mono-ADP-ribosyltransferase PARP4 isoform X2 [Betta splendens]